jgi:adenylate kinase
MKNIIFLGAPGSGKGTQASIISEKFGYPLISVGDLLREAVKNQTEIGKKAKAIMQAGELVSDEIVLNLVKERISAHDCDNGFILDGLPRNATQAVELDKILQSINKSINLIFNISVSDDNLIKRISGRFSCAKCGEIYNEFFKKTKQKGVCDKCLARDFIKREDDNENSVKNRLNIFHKNLESIIDHYLPYGKIRNIDGQKDIDKISNDIVANLLD